MVGMLFYLLAIPVPKMVLDAGQYFANMTLPLALLCTGGSLDIGSSNMKSIQLGSRPH